MKSFLALLRLQLLSRYADMKPRNLKTALKEKKGRTIGMIIAVIFAIAYLGGMLFYLETQMIDILIRLHMPEMLVTLAVVLATTGTLIMAFFFTLSVLYLGRDATYLASLPIKPRTLLSAKLTQVWISETCIDALLILPACILYGVKTGAEALFYVRMIVVWLLIAILPICLIAFLSSLLIRLSALWKHRETIMTVGGIALLVAYMFLMSNLGGMTGSSTTDGGAMMESFVTGSASRFAGLTKMFPPAEWAAEGMLGQNNQMFLVWILVSLAAPVVTVWLLGYSYRKLSMMQSETPGGKKKKFTGRESFTAGGQLKACILREVKTILRVPSYATNILPICFMPLMMVIIFSVSIGKAGESLSGLFQSMHPALIMGILAAMMAYMAGMNPALSTAVTREGKGHDFLTALPVPTMTFIRAKFIVGYGFGAAGVIAASIALLIMYPGVELQVIMALVLCLLFSYVNCALALSRDIKKPKLDWVTEQEAVKQNFGVMISMFVSWGILIALAALTYVLIDKLHLELLPIFGILAGALVILAIAAHAIMKNNAEKYYCKG